MDRLVFRDAVTELIYAHFQDRTDCRVLYENGPDIDMNTSTLPVLAYEIAYENSVQADLNRKPLIQDSGNILVTILIKSFSGNRKAVELREEAIRLLQQRELGGATLRVARLIPNSQDVKGWVGYRFTIPFWHYHF